MLAYYLRMDLGTGRPTPLFSACGPCGGGGCLDRAYMLKRNPRGLPYFVGDTWSLRLKIENPVTRAALNLDDYLIIATFKRLATDFVGIVRRSDTEIIGSVPTVQQIAIDDQTTDNGTNGVTGRGWFQFNFASVTSDFCEMLSLVGDACFDVRLQNTDTGALTTVLNWCLGVYEPKTLLTNPLPPTPPPTPIPDAGSGIYSCAANISLGDVVYLASANTVGKASATSSLTPAWGIVTSKPSTYSAIVLFAAGEVALYTGLVAMTQYYLDTTAGAFTDDVSGFVAGNIVQHIGRARNATTLVTEIDNDFIVL